MKRWKKRVLFGASVLVIVSIAGAIVLLLLLRGTPAWYRPGAMSDAQREAAAQRAMNKLVLMQNQAAQARADERIEARQREAAANPPQSRTPSRPTSAPGAFEVNFSDDEINAFLATWSVWRSVRESYSKFMSDPYVLIDDDRIILAGKLNDIDAVASLHFEPYINSDGRLNLKLVRVLAGNLPLPQAALEKYQQRAALAVGRRLPYWRRGAAIDRSGIANGSAISAAMGELLSNILAGTTSEPVLFLPLVDQRGCVPVKLLDIKTGPHTLTIVAQPMTPAERASLLEHIRGEPSAQLR